MTRPAMTRPSTTHTRAVRHVPLSARADRGLIGAWDPMLWPIRDFLRSVVDSYAAGRILMECGVIQGSDMTPEAALTKLSYLLAKDDLTAKQRKAMLAQNIRGMATSTSFLTGFRAFLQLRPTQHALCAILYLVTMLIAG